MFILLDILISSGIGLVAIIVAIVSLLEGRKRTKLLETMIKTLPYTTRNKGTKSVANRKSKNDAALTKARSDEVRRMKLELEKEKLQWQKNKDIAKGLAWIIDRLNTDEEYEDE